jgi:four helix bundle protein
MRHRFNDRADFAKQFQDRTKKLAIEIIQIYKTLKTSDEMRIVGQQLIRSASSVGANYRAVCRARSKAELFSKLSIVIEEADETLYWLEVLKGSELAQGINLDHLIAEITEVLSVMAKARSTIRRNN